MYKRKRSIDDIVSKGEIQAYNFFFFFFFLTALLAFYSDTIVVNEKLHVHKCEGEK